MIEASMRRLPPTLSPDWFERRLNLRLLDPSNEQHYHAVTVGKQSQHPVRGGVASYMVCRLARRTNFELLDDRFIFSDNAIEEFKSDATYPVFFDDQFFNGREYNVELGWPDFGGFL